MTMAMDFYAAHQTYGLAFTGCVMAVVVVLIGPYILKIKP
jgi:hypothetical protein